MSKITISNIQEADQIKIQGQGSLIRFLLDMAERGAHAMAESRNTEQPGLASKTTTAWYRELERQIALAGQDINNGSILERELHLLFPAPLDPPYVEDDDPNGTE